MKQKLFKSYVTGNTSPTPNKNENKNSKYSVFAPPLANEQLRVEAKPQAGSHVISGQRRDANLHSCEVGNLLPEGREGEDSLNMILQILRGPKLSSQPQTLHLKSQEPLVLIFFY